jgi:hypothetical protein
MPFATPRCNSGLCHFKEKECRKGCVSAIPDPEDENNWRCLWVETLRSVAFPLSGYTVSQVLDKIPLIDADHTPTVTTAKKRS